MTSEFFVQVEHLLGVGVAFLTIIFGLLSVLNRIKKSEADRKEFEHHQESSRRELSFKIEKLEVQMNRTVQFEEKISNKLDKLTDDLSKMRLEIMEAHSNMANKVTALEAKIELK